MHLPRAVELESDARMALGTIIGIMSDQAMSGTACRWDVERLLELEVRLGIPAGVAGDDQFGEIPTVILGIDDVALLLEGMAFTEVASADLPWIDMVRWTSDFVTAELRRHWTDGEWLEMTAGSA